jgi:hypothetical protein
MRFSPSSPSFAALRRCFSATASEISWLLSVSAASAIHLSPGAHSHVSVPASAAVRLTRSPAEQQVTVVGSDASTPLAVTLPQRMESEVQGSASVRIAGKLEGSCTVQAVGDIDAVGTLRGAYLDLESTGGRVEVRRGMEGVSSVRAATGLACARAMGERVTLRTAAGALHVGAAFGDITLEHTAPAAAPGAASAPPASVFLGGAHGSAHVFSASAPVVARGITGRLRVTGAPAACTAQFDSLRGDSSLDNVQGSVTVHVCPPVSLRLQVAAGGGLHVFPGPGGSYVDGLLVSAASGAAPEAGREGAGEGAGSGQGGSGKIREGSAITGWWNYSEGAAGGSGPSTLSISCQGEARVYVQSYAEKLQAEAAQAK